MTGKRMARRIILALLLISVIGAVAFLALAWRTEIAAIEPPTRTSFDAQLVSRGAQLSAIGNCVVCHTASSGRPYAGGYPVQTQFGTIYGTNITPDAETGIGRWSGVAFTRAMREGVDRQGRHLYPAFPYDHFALLGDDDIQALYAFLMTREPVRLEAPANDVPFPLNIRMLMAGWKLLFLENRSFQPDTAQSAEWNRGAYLTQGLGHCGACHTPRNALGAEQKKHYLAGAEIEGWHAPAINAASPAPVPWTADSLFRYLRFGASDQHAVAAGPMASVVHNLSRVPESEVRAIATYIAATMGAPDAQRQQRAQKALTTARAASASVNVKTTEADKQSRASKESRLQTGAQLYAGSCATCHDASSRPPGSPTDNALHLSLASALALPTPANLIRIILQGMAPPDGETGSFMPGFASEFTDAQIASLVSYLRASYSDRVEWRDLEREVREARQQAGNSKR